MYRRPRIKEALCEVQFADGAWRFGSPGLIHEQLREAYPAEPQQVASTTVEMGPGGQVRAFQVQQQKAKTRFSSADEERLVLVGEGTVSIHLLGPYPGWESFLRAIREAVDAYHAVVEPTRVARIGVRYVNLFDFGIEPVELSDYFSFSPESPEGLDLNVAGFFHRTEYVCPDTVGRRLVQTFGSVDAESGSAAIALDLDAVQVWNPERELLAFGDLLPAVEDLRSFERDAFEGLIKDRLRELLDAEG